MQGPGSAQTLGRRPLQGIREVGSVGVMGFAMARAVVKMW